MKVLISLSILKLKARVRMLFSKKSSAILTILAILFYGAIMFVSLNLDDTLAVSLFDKHGLVLLAVGYTALMVLSVDVYKRQPLPEWFYQKEDETVEVDEAEVASLLASLGGE